MGQADRAEPPWGSRASGRAGVIFVHLFKQVIADGEKPLQGKGAKRTGAFGLAACQGDEINPRQDRFAAVLPARKAECFTSGRGGKPRQVQR